MRAWILAAVGVSMTAVLSGMYGFTLGSISVEARDAAPVVPTFYSNPDWHTVAPPPGYGDFACWGFYFDRSQPVVCFPPPPEECP